jgi:hypothetical protein
MNLFPSYAIENACFTPGIQYGTVGGVTLRPLPYLTEVNQCEVRILVQTHITTKVKIACANILCCSAANGDGGSSSFTVGLPIVIVRSCTTSCSRARGIEHVFRGLCQLGRISTSQNGWLASHLGEIANCAHAGDARRTSTAFR